MGADTAVLDIPISVLSDEESPPFEDLKGVQQSGAEWARTIINAAKALSYRSDSLAFLASAINERESPPIEGRIQILSEMTKLVRGLPYRDVAEIGALSDTITDVIKAAKENLHTLSPGRLLDIAEGADCLAYLRKKSQHEDRAHLSDSNDGKEFNTKDLVDEINTEWINQYKAGNVPQRKSMRQASRLAACVWGQHIEPGELFDILVTEISSYTMLQK